MTFQKIVLIVALILLIISLVVIGVLIKSSMVSAKFPPEISKCPDYFTVQLENGKITCKNPLGLGRCAEGLTPVPGDDMNARVQNCRLAKQSCGVTWDGLTSSTANQGNPYC